MVATLLFIKTHLGRCCCAWLPGTPSLGDVTLAVASGITPENASQYVTLVNAFLVAPAFLCEATFIIWIQGDLGLC